MIVESPAKAKTIKKYLGNGYTVKASVGHIKDLPKSKLGVDVDHGFTPEYEVIRGGWLRRGLADGEDPVPRPSLGVPQPDGRFAILFGDASGHGMAAGLVMAVAHAAFRTQLDVDPSPAAIITALNRILCRTGGPRSFFACCYVLLSPNGDFVAITAGHPEILKIDRAGKVVDRLGKGSYPLGIKTTLSWQEIRDTLQCGERLLLHSDGLTEARNRTGHEFGDSYVEAIVSWNPSAAPAAMVNSLVAEWKAFATGREPEDDVSIAVVQRR